jgi:hypothetical protein
MIERDQLQRLRRWSQELTRENTQLREELDRAAQQCTELSDANVNLRVERDAADVLLGEAIDRLLSGSGQ